jgi:hypothetical protein
MVMCCAREVLERLCEVYTRSSAIIRMDAIARNKALVQVRHEGKHLQVKSDVK